MDKIFAQRRRFYYEQNNKYLRYVFNDHFVLFLFIAFGTLAVEYAKLLNNNNLTLIIRLIIILLVSLISLLPGKVVSLLEEADSTFLLAKEEEVKKQLLKSQLYSMFFPLVVILSATLIASPLVKLTGIAWFIWFILLIFLKNMLFTLKMRSFQASGQLDWQGLISYEQKRKTNLFKIFSLFTDVKGLTSQAKRRKYLDFLLPEKSKSVYGYLFWRTFLRSGDYLSMTFRLSLLAVLGIIFIESIWIALLFASLMNYLLVFQLLALKKSQDFQPFIRIYPIKSAGLSEALANLIFKLVIFVHSLELISLSAVLIVRKMPSQLLLGFVFFLLTGLAFRLYINFRLKTKK